MAAPASLASFADALRSHINQSPALFWIVLALAFTGSVALAQYPVDLLRLLFSFLPVSQNTVSLKDLARNASKSHLVNRDGNEQKKPIPAWAIVTGPTAGIGKEFAIQLAQAGFSLILMGRNQEKLKDLITSIQQISPNTVAESMRIDFRSSSESDWEKIREGLKTLSFRAPISVLVNNAGCSHSQPVPFELAPSAEIDSIHSVNIVTPVKLTQIVLPFMLEHRKGLILNMGSFSALIPTPYLAAYSASKAFLSTWSQALGTELKSKGIHVRLVNAYFVVSDMSKIRKPTFLVPTPSGYVKSVLKVGGSAGAIGKPFITTPFFSQSLIEFIVDRFGTWEFWLNYNLQLHQSIMRKAEAKKQRLLAANKGNEEEKMAAQ